MNNTTKYILEDVTLNNKQYTRIYLIPTLEEINNLHPGMLVKLVFLLEDVLSFKPLLERILAEKGYGYEYSEDENKFIRVE